MVVSQEKEIPDFNPTEVLWEYLQEQKLTVL